LFGHRKGSFTGAINDHAGYFEQANGGTIFLDEIGDMKPDIQAKVLRVIEDKKVRRVGEKTEREIDMRIISATNRNLKEAIASSGFRGDLYYRLEEYCIHIPPLRERKEDIPVIAENFLESLCVFYELEPMQISESAMKDIMNYSWPGNIRELKNVIQRSAVRNTGRIIDVIDIPGEIKPAAGDEVRVSDNRPADKGTAETLGEMESRAIKEALTQTNGNVAKAAVILDIGRATLYRKIEKLGIKLS
jgi:two-component system response regulator AtoC